MQFLGSVSARHVGCVQAIQQRDILQNEERSPRLPGAQKPILVFAEAEGLVEKPNPVENPPGEDSGRQVDVAHRLVRALERNVQILGARQADVADAPRHDVQSRIREKARRLRAQLALRPQVVRVKESNQLSLSQADPPVARGGRPGVGLIHIVNIRPQIPDLSERFHPWIRRQR